MKCILCVQLDLHTHDKLARLGFGRCRTETASVQWESFRFERICSRYQQVTDDVATKRTSWSDNQLKARVLGA